MPSHRASAISQNSEDGRAFLQARVTLFWKVMFFIILLSSGLGAVGAIAKPSVDLALTLALTAEAGAFWWLCGRGQRSLRFSRVAESSGLLLNLTGGALLGRYLLAGFVREHSLATAEGILMADGYLIGTPQYLAPESILDPDAADVRSDLYALGAVAYFLLAGSEVFDGRSLLELCIQHVHKAPLPLATHGVHVPAELEALVLACLEKEPGRRPQSAAELRQRLAACAVDPWTDESARSWWLEHQPRLDRDAARTTDQPRPIAIDGAPRLAPALP